MFDSSLYFWLTANPVYHDDIHVVVDESLFHHPLVKQLQHANNNEKKIETSLRITVIDYCDSAVKKTSNLDPFLVAMLEVAVNYEEDPPRRVQSAALDRFHVSSHKILHFPRVFFFRLRKGGNYENST